MRNKPLNQKGFGLVELVIAITIATLVVAAAVAIWFQLTSVSARNSDYMTAYGQVQNAGYWFSRDAVQITQEPTFESGKLVTLDWVEWDGSEHQVVYILDDESGELSRSGTEGSFLVAQYIDSNNTSCTWDGETLTLEITAQFGDNSATRTYKVEPRSF